ncbi:MAG TPA: glycosyltransferase family 4 protein [Vicinamibacterales bacterium]|nr:glycosyltransferase family 4 protein [Vicinamibacterales bacterium]
MKRLLTIGHSYVVAVNRRLAHEMAVAGAGEWEVTAAAPDRYPGDLRPIDLERRAGEACRVVPLRVHFAAAPHLMFYGGGLRALLRERWDLVHCWEEPYVLAAAQVAGSLAPRVPFVFATFQNIPKRYPPPLNWFERRVLRRADGWIPFGQSTFETQRRRSARYSALPARVIPPGVDQTVFRPDEPLGDRTRARLGWNDNAPIVGFVGRFVPAKGIGTLLSALEHLDAPWRILFVGAGPEQPLVDAFAARFPARVASIAGVPHDEVPAWLNAMDVLCAPSRTTGTWREQFGRMLIEAMACGVAVIGSDSGEIPHVVGDAGIIVPEDDVAAWSRAIESLLVSPARRAELAARGLERVREQFTWSASARRHLEFFAELT